MYLFIYLFVSILSHKGFSSSSSSFLTYLFTHWDYFLVSTVELFFVGSIKNFRKSQMASPDDGFNKLDTLSDENYLKLIEKFYEKVREGKKMSCFLLISILFFKECK